MDATLKRRMLDFCRSRASASVLGELLDLRAVGLLSPDSVIDLLETAGETARYQAERLLARMSATVWEIAFSPSEQRSRECRFEVLIGGNERWTICCRRAPTLRVWRILR